MGQDDRGPVWVFSGQGSQWAAMGADLANEPAFAACIAEVEPLIAREAGFSVTEAMSAPETVTGIDRVQPVLFAMQVALAAAMRSYEVHPSAVIGHSLGEVSAAVVAGALSLEDGVRGICRRSRLCLRVAGGGAMAAISYPPSGCATIWPPAVRQTSRSPSSPRRSPPSSVARPRRSGTWSRRRSFEGSWPARWPSTWPPTRPTVDPILADLADMLAELTPPTPAVGYYSATLDDPRAQPALDAAYWVDNLRRPVRFAAAVQAALDDGHRVFAELSHTPC